VTNWAAYDIASRQRGSLTVWFTEAVIAAWKAEPRCTRGGQPRYSALAITTALTPRAEPRRCRPRRWALMHIGAGSPVVYKMLLAQPGSRWQFATRSSRSDNLLMGLARPVQRL